MQPYNLESIFDGIYHKAIPLILFSIYDDSKIFSDLLGSLFDAFYRNDDISFNEIYNELDRKINDRRDYGSHKELLIKVFGDRFLSLDQRISNIDKVIINFKSGLKQIERNQMKISYYGKKIKMIEKMDKKIHIEKSEKKREKIITSKDIKTNVNLCPICNTKIRKNNTLPDGQSKWYCKDSTGKYLHWYVRNNNGDFYFCKKCGAIMLGSGKTLRCSNCDYKEKVVE